jgi:hypothetical protein
MSSRDDESGTEETGTDNEHSGRDLDRRTSGGVNGNRPESDPVARVEPAGGVEGLHGGGREGRGRIDGSSAGITGPITGQFTQISASYRESPWLPPDELEAYNRIDPEFSRTVMATIREAQQARIDAELVPIRAEAWALKVATLGVTFLPWIAAALAAVFALNGHDTAALVSGLFTVASGGAQIIYAVRRPQAQHAQTNPTPTQVAKKPTRAERKEAAKQEKLDKN